MTFDSVVTYLHRHHDPLWFRTAEASIVSQDASAWRESEILTAGGRIVAMQTGHWDEWQLTAGADRPDSDFPEGVPPPGYPARGSRGDCGTTGASGSNGKRPPCQAVKTDGQKPLMTACFRKSARERAFYRRILP